MAHTDRDDDRAFWRNHHHNLCPDSYRFSRLPVACEVCPTEPHRRFYVSTAAYSEWAKDCRREERARAKHAMRECRDWDNLVINYRRPYFD